MGYSQSSLVYDLKDFHSLNDSTFLLINDDNNSKLISIYNSYSNKIVKEFVNKGRGPGEIETLGAFTVDQNNKSLFLSDFNSSKLIHYNVDGTFVNEKLLPLKYITTLSNYNETLIASTSFFVLPKEIDNKTVPISYLIEIQNFNITDTLFFNINELPLQQIKKLDKLQFLKLSPKTVQIAPDLFIIVFEQINYVFLINKMSKIIDKRVVDIPNYEMITTVTHPEFGTGVRSRDVFNDFSHFRDGIIFTYGDRSLEMPFGVIYINLNKNRISNQIYPLKNQKELQTEKLSITHYHKKIWGFNGLKFIELNF